MNKFILSESERSEILKKHSSYKKYLMENFTNYTMQDLQTVLQTKLGLDLGSSGVDGKFGKKTKAAIIQALDMVKSQIKPVETLKTPEGTPKSPEVAPDKTTGDADVNLASTETSTETSTDTTTIS